MDIKRFFNDNSIRKNGWNYWIYRKWKEHTIKYYNGTFNPKYWKFTNDEQIGYLPTTIDQNAFKISDIKIFEETFIVPENAIVFFVINNLDGKNEFIWKLSNSVTNEEIILVKSVPFFVWKFKDLGQYSLSVQVFDNKNNTYFSEMQNFIRVLNKSDYVGEIEQALNLRKIDLLKNRV